MNSRRCAACKHLRRRCPSDCIFSPYFPSNNPGRFAFVHKIYGASNVGKILQDLPASCRALAADTLYYEASWRIRDPVYGCVRMVSLLLQQLNIAECQLALIKAEIRNQTTGVEPTESLALPSAGGPYDHTAAAVLPSTSMYHSSPPTWFQ